MMYWFIIYTIVKTDVDISSVYFVKKKSTDTS